MNNNNHELERKIALLEKTKDALIAKLDNEGEVLQNPSPKWLMLVRDPFKYTGHWMYGLGRTLFFLLIFSMLFVVK